MNNNFSENLKKIRKDNNLSQEALAEMLNVSRQAISKWESKQAYPEMDKIIQLCDKFNLNIDDLLHKDIREIKSEVEAKKNINKYIDEFLNFIVNTINMFINMTFKSKIKCLFEEFILVIIFYLFFYILSLVFSNLLFGILNMLPTDVYYVVISIIKAIYTTLSILISFMILIHIFKIRYLDYYLLAKSNIDKDEKNNVGSHENNKIVYKEESKLIIRDPKHSEYRFINIVFKFILGIIKFIVLCFSVFLFIFLILTSIGIVLSFLLYKTGFLFIGLLLLCLSLSIILVDVILLILNFIFSRKSDKKKMIWSFIISLVSIGISCGFITCGCLEIKYIDDNISNVTNYVEFEKKDLEYLKNINLYYDVTYIDNKNDNIKIEYNSNEYCKLYTYYSGNEIIFYENVTDLLSLARSLIKDLNNKEIHVFNCNLNKVTVYTSIDNINKLKQK